MEVEVCAYSLESCRAARAAGANRVELCAGMYEGGTTPSIGTIRAARQLTVGMELYVMIRPRGGDFLYTDEEFGGMLEDIRAAREAGAEGVVLGILDADGRVDEERMGRAVREAAGMKVTFHRAFDMTADWHEALEAVIRVGCYRILTSGQRNTVDEGSGTIREIVRSARGRVSIMAGSGVNAGNAAALAALGVDALHLSGKAHRDSAMRYRNPAVSMGGVAGVPEYDIAYCDERKIRAVVDAVRTK